MQDPFFYSMYSEYYSYLCPYNLLGVLGVHSGLYSYVLLLVVLLNCSHVSGVLPLTEYFPLMRGHGGAHPKRHVTLPPPP